MCAKELAHRYSPGLARAGPVTVSSLSDKPGLPSGVGLIPSPPPLQRICPLPVTIVSSPQSSQSNSFFIFLWMQGISLLFVKREVSLAIFFALCFKSCREGTGRYSRLQANSVLLLQVIQQYTEIC